MPQLRAACGWQLHLQWHCLRCLDLLFVCLHLSSAHRSNEMWFAINSREGTDGCASPLSYWASAPPPTPLCDGPLTGGSPPHPAHQKKKEKRKQSSKVLSQRCQPCINALLKPETSWVPLSASRLSSRFSTPCMCGPVDLLAALISVTKSTKSLYCSSSILLSPPTQPQGLRIPHVSTIGRGRLGEASCHCGATHRVRGAVEVHNHQSSPRLFFELNKSTQKMDRFGYFFNGYYIDLLMLTKQFIILFNGLHYYCIQVHL